MNNFEYLKQIPNSKNSNSKVIILLHGYGSNMYDLFDLVKYFGDGNFFFSLNGCADLGFQAKCRYQADFTTQTPKYYFKDVEIAITYLNDFINYMKENYDIDSKEIFLVGFSQGGILSNFALNEIPGISGGVLLSTRLLKEQLETEIKNISKDKKIFIGHGEYDNVIDISYAVESLNYFQNLGINPVYKIYDLEHGINLKELSDISRFLG